MATSRTFLERQWAQALCFLRSEDILSSFPVSRWRGLLAGAVPAFWDLEVVLGAEALRARTTRQRNLGKKPQQELQTSYIPRLV